MANERLQLGLRAVGGNRYGRLLACFARDAFGAIVFEPGPLGVGEQRAGNVDAQAPQAIGPVSRAVAEVFEARALEADLVERRDAAASRR